MPLDLSAGNRNREVLQLIVNKKYIYRKENQYSIFYFQCWLHQSPPLAVILDKMVLLYFWHRSNVSFDPVGGLLDLDVNQRGISGACRLESAAALKPERRTAASLRSGGALRVSAAAVGMIAASWAPF